MGRGSEVGEAILQHPAVAAVSFTGSIETGRKVAAACTSATPMKKFQLEMGGRTHSSCPTMPISRSRSIAR